MAKYPDLDSERSRTYLRSAFRTGLASEALVLARKEGWKFKMFWFELSIGKGAGSYKIAKAVAEKSKEKVVVAKKVEIPKKAVKKVAEGNFEFND